MTVIENSRMSAGVNEFVAAVQLARSEAVKRRLPVTLCRSSDSTSATPSCGTGAAWQDGWIVFVDDNDGDGGSQPRNADRDSS